MAISKSFIEKQRESVEAVRKEETVAVATKANDTVNTDEKVVEKQN